MRTAVYFLSRKGSSRAVAEAIAKAASCKCEPLLPAYMPDYLDLVFLGCEGRRADSVTLQFIGSLKPTRVRACALYVCGKENGVALAQMRRALNDRGIRVLRQTFVAPCAGLFSKGPGQADLERAKQFCLDSIGQIQEG
ncbi:MAG: hypothetical protein IKE30_06345 [Clostridia bacterium]|nr:hypothetical protein [Clostridia bacterium]